MTTLKELKKKYPNLITTSGSNYLIEGFGWYRQKTDAFGLWTSHKDLNGNWHEVSFDELVRDFENLHKEQSIGEDKKTQLASLLIELDVKTIHGELNRAIENHDAEMCRKYLGITDAIETILKYLED